MKADLQGPELVKNDNIMFHPLKRGHLSNKNTFVRLQVSKNNNNMFLGHLSNENIFLRLS